MRVDERREHVLALCIHRVRAFGRGHGTGSAQFDDSAVADEDVARLVKAGARIEDVRLADQ